MTRLAAKPFGFAAAAFLAFMMVYTTFTVLLRQFLGIPTVGVVDVMELALVGMIFFAMPGVFLRDENVTVDVVDQVVPRAVRTGLRLLGLAVTLGFLILLLVPMIPQAMHKYATGEVTMTLSINRFLHWIPILVGFAGAILATVWVLLHYLRHGAPKDQTLDPGEL